VASLERRFDGLSMAFEALVDLLSDKANISVADVRVALEEKLSTESRRRTLVCAHCNHTNRGNRAKCMYCGSALPGEAL